MIYKKANITLIAFLLCFVVNTTAQDIPFPTENDALNNIKSSKSLANVLKRDYGINSISNLTIKRDDYPGDFNSGFSLYYSLEAQKYSWKNPADRCTITFRAISKKNAEGIYYDIPVNVTYTRLIRRNLETYITNKWEYFNWELGSPIIYGAKKITPEIRSAVVYEALTKVFDSGFDKNKAGINFYLYGLESCIKIDTVYPNTSRKDIIDSPKKQRWELTMKADFANIENGAKMTHLGENLGINVEITAILVDGKWEASDIAIRRPPSINEYKGSELYATFKEIGLAGIYKKRTVKTVPRYSKAYLDIYAKKFEKTVKSLSNDEVKDLENLSFFIENGDKEIAKSIRNFYLEMNKKQVEFTKENYAVSIYMEGSKKIRKAYLIFQSRLERGNGVTDKALGKQFLAAGMSKKALKQGKFWENYKQSWDLVFKNDRWYITTKMEKDFEVPF